MKTKSSGFGPSLIELVVAVALFAVAAAVCVRLLSGAKILSDDGAALSHAVVCAQSAAECFKTAGGDAEACAKLLSGELTEHGFEIWFDSDFKPCSQGGKYLLMGNVYEENRVLFCKIDVYEGMEGIYGITAAVRREATA